MAVLLVTYDLKQPGRDYTPVYDYLNRFTYCKGMESVWLLDTSTPCAEIRDDLQTVVDSNDIIFVVRLMRDWASFNYGCSSWLNDAARNW